MNETDDDDSDGCDWDDRLLFGLIWTNCWFESCSIENKIQFWTRTRSLLIASDGAWSYGSYPVIYNANHNGTLLLHTHSAHFPISHYTLKRIIQSYWDVFYEDNSSISYFNHNGHEYLSRFKRQRLPRILITSAQRLSCQSQSIHFSMSLW